MAPGDCLACSARDMDTRETEIVYETAVRFDENRIRDAAVYCSDGRFGEHFDDFLHNALNCRGTTVSPCRAGRRVSPGTFWPIAKKKG